MLKISSGNIDNKVKDLTKKIAWLVLLVFAFSHLTLVFQDEITDVSSFETDSPLNVEKSEIEANDIIYTDENADNPKNIGLTTSTNYIPYSGVIYILSNQNFTDTAVSKGWAGTGTMNDPIIIENYYIRTGRADINTQIIPLLGM